VIAFSLFNVPVFYPSLSSWVSGSLFFLRNVFFPPCGVFLCGRFSVFLVPTTVLFLLRLLEVSSWQKQLDCFSLRQKGFPEEAFPLLFPAVLPPWVPRMVTLPASLLSFPRLPVTVGFPGFFRGTVFFSSATLRAPVSSFFSRGFF